MSIINQMLKDLEKRTKPLTVPDYIISGGYPKRTSYILKNKKLMSLAGVLIAAIVFLMLLFNLNKNTVVIANSSPKNVIETPAKNLIQNIKITPLSVVPTTLVGVTLEVLNDLTDLRLMLSQNILYQISVIDEQHVQVVLEHAQLVANAPPVIDNKGSALEGIQMTNEQNGNLNIELTLKKGAELANLNLLTTGKYPELQIAFQYKEEVSDANQTVSDNSQVFQTKSNSIKKLRYDIMLDNQYQNALVLAAQGKTTEAVSLLNEILTKNPEFTVARIKLVSLLLEQNDDTLAQKILKVGLLQEPHYPPYIKLKAHLLVKQGKSAEALRSLLVAPPDLKDDKDYHAFIAALYQQNGQHEHARNTYERLLVLEPNNATWWMGLGISLENIGEKNDAMEAYRIASNDESLKASIKEFLESRLSALQS